MAAKGTKGEKGRRGGAPPAGRWRKCQGCGVKTDQCNTDSLDGKAKPLCWRCFYQRLASVRADALAERNGRIRELHAQAECARVERRGLERNLDARTRERDLALRRIEAQKRTILHLVGMLCEERDRSAGLGESIENEAWRRAQEEAARPIEGIAAAAPAVADTCETPTPKPNPVGSLPVHRKGQILRTGDGPTALMRVETVRAGHGGLRARYWGPHCMGGETVAVYHEDAQLPTLADLDTWRKHNAKDRHRAQAIKAGVA